MGASGMFPHHVTKTRQQAIPYLLSCFLPIPFHPIMRFAEHLAVLDVGGTAFAPGGDMVGIHFGLLLDAGGVGFAFDGVEGGVGLIEKFSFT